MPFSLTDEEKGYLKAYNAKMTHVKDAVKGVVHSFGTGLFVYGEGGTSKSYTILGELQKCKAKYVLHNTRMTGRGLVDSLERAPSDVHVIEDAETLLDDKRAWGVLRSALWSQSKAKPPERIITWTAFNTQIRFVFTGGIIVISNANLAFQNAEIRAIKTRINVLGLDISNNEIKALMKSICLKGHTYGDDYLTPDECLEVATFIVDKLESLNRNLDLRLLMNGFKDVLQWKAGSAHNHWHVLLEGRMKERILPTYKGRSDTKREQATIAMEIHAMKLSTKEKVKLWQDKTGLTQAAYYRALKRTAK